MPPVSKQYRSRQRPPSPPPQFYSDVPSPPRPVDPTLKAMRKTMSKAAALANAMFDEAFPDSAITLDPQPAHAPAGKLLDLKLLFIESSNVHSI